MLYYNITNLHDLEQLCPRDKIFQICILILQEDPGESLSDCDKDDEENLEEEGCAKAEEDEDSEDGFFVPDGYLSENEV